MTWLSIQTLQITMRKRALNLQGILTFADGVGIKVANWLANKGRYLNVLDLLYIHIIAATV